MERLSTGALTRVIVCIMIIGGVSSVFATGANEGARVLVNGQAVTFSHPTQTIQTTLFAPIQPIADLMGATYRWNPATQTATIIYGNTGVAVAIDNTKLTIRNMTTGRENEVTLHVPPRIHYGTEYYPIEAIVKELGATVTWNTATNTINIITPENVQPPPPTVAQGSSPGAATTTAPPPPETTPASPPASRPAATPTPTRNYRAEAARRNVMSPSVFSLIGYNGVWWGGALYSLMTTKLAGTIQDGKFGLTAELFNMNYSLFPYLSLGLGAGMGMTFKDSPKVNWLGVKPYVGFTVPFWADDGATFRLHGDGFLEVGYSGWGSLLTNKDTPGFALNPGFELGLGFMFDEDDNFWTGLEASYGITFYPGSRLKHNIGLAVRVLPNW